MPPSTRLPPEILMTIFDDLDPFDLISCCIVCCEWHFTALPLLGKKRKVRRLQTQRHNIGELERFAHAFAFSRQHGLALGTVVKRVEMRIDFPETLARLVYGLNHLRMLMLDFNDKNIPGYLELLDEFLTELKPGFQGIVNLSVSNLPDSASISHEKANFANRYSTPTFIRLRLFANPTKSSLSDQISPLIRHPLVSLISDTHSRLQHLTLFNCHFSPTESVSLSLALRRCPNIRALRLHNTSITLPADHLADTVASWLDLVHFSVRARFPHKWFDQPSSFLGPTFRRLALAKPPRRLTVLEVQAHVTSATDRELRRLITASALTLQQLYLPSVNNYEGDALLAHICALSMPVLSILDIVLTHCRHRSHSVIEKAPPLRWPELRVVAMATCRGTMWDLGRRLVKLFPHVNCVLVKSCSKSPGYERLTGLLAENGFKKLKLREGLWSQVEPWVTEKYEEGEWEENEDKKWGRDDGFLVRL